MLLGVKYFEIFSKHNKYGFVSNWGFCVELIYFCSIDKWKAVASIVIQT